LNIFVQTSNRVKLLDSLSNKSHLSLTLFCIFILANSRTVSD